MLSSSVHGSLHSRGPALLLERRRAGPRSLHRKRVTSALFSIPVPHSAAFLVAAAVPNAPLPGPLSSLPPEVLIGAGAGACLVRVQSKTWKALIWEMLTKDQGYQ